MICPGGAEHLGILVDPPNTVPERYADHKYVFHNPVVFVPRLQPVEIVEVAREITKRLVHSESRTVFMMPLGGTGSYAKQGGPLHDPDCDRVFFDELESCMPAGIEVVRCDTDAEDPEFVAAAVKRLVALIAER